MAARNLLPSLPASRRQRVATLLAAALLALSVGGCEDRGDLLGVELVVFTVGEWVGIGPQGEELRFVLERDDDDPVITAIIIELPGLADAAQGEPEACAAVVNAFTRFGNLDVRVPVRGARFSFSTPGDFRFDNDGLIEVRIEGAFDSPESVTVDADFVIDATRVVPCRAEFMVSWQMEPVGS